MRHDVARSYRLMVDGKTYDSKAIVGAAHGFLPGQEALTARDFGGGAATVGRPLSRLGFEVTQAVPGLTVGELIEQLSVLRRYRSPDGRLALYQPLTLLWAFGRAHQGLARMAEWSETEAALGHLGQAQQVDGHIGQLFPDVSTALAPCVECFGDLSLEHRQNSRRRSEGPD